MNMLELVFTSFILKYFINGENKCPQEDCLKYYSKTTCGYNMYNSKQVFGIHPETDAVILQLLMMVVCMMIAIVLLKYFGSGANRADILSA